MQREKWLLALTLATAFGFGVSTARAASIIDEWANVKAPPAPSLKAPQPCADHFPAHRTQFDRYDQVLARA